MSWQTACVACQTESADRLDINVIVFVPCCLPIGNCHILLVCHALLSLLGLLQVLLEFIEVIYNDKDNIEDSVTKAAVALLGDLAITLPHIGQLFSQKPYTLQFVQDAASSGITSLTDTATWAHSAISKAVAQPAGV